MSTRFTPLESDILDALAWDLRDIAPDLGGQFAESLPGSRRNTGSGLFTELIVDRSRPPPLTDPTGRFGTVHAMVGDLPDPIAFQVELRQGRLLSLHGDAYGQDTRAIDFARVPFDQIFVLNDQGESIAFDPAVLMQPSPLLDLHRHEDHEPPFPAEPRAGDRDPHRWAQEPSLQNVLDVVFGKIEPSAPAAAAAGEAPPDKADQTSVLIGLWVAIAAVAFLAVVFFDVPFFFAVVLAGVVGQTLHKPKVRSALARGARRLGQYEYRPPQR
ncbi:hypothetical protein [Brevundimonas sp. UBA7664]|uniref:hypothetical protein n=1 Tax=Brevundimonas sp. UBA7664 TaxID=1946141 RepID=UPI0025BD8F22|nr:hypothetical protein [Brevundimonas sp. UBA7664]